MSVTFHTDLGDLKIELFCEQVPIASENFLALCASDYYNNCKFHRNIKGFMLQTGDPTGTGKGGNSIWGRKFEDELREGLKVRYLFDMIFKPRHDKTNIVRLRPAWIKTSLCG
ncbi:peptidyl-prolyl cis-trans isomerase-like 3 [Ruditapes philippinarum]|uniref:peptidyl-prolyl cis-trans isomerase-like 3 n=1 Tax=Ruditapes philippinarum TaxID=129788 RepID=UPI00295BBF30|nr:peptidyl-prolyl cis-trans isomerase-like 3 [Ruditapes philippinarum]